MGGWFVLGFLAVVESLSTWWGIWVGLIGHFGIVFCRMFPCGWPTSFLFLGAAIFEDVALGTDYHLLGHLDSSVGRKTHSEHIVSRRQFFSC
jgi:hypothetical protein